MNLIRAYSIVLASLLLLTGLYFWAARWREPTSCYLVSSRADELGLEKVATRTNQLELLFLSRDDVKLLWRAIKIDLNQPPDAPDLVSGNPICHVLLFGFGENSKSQKICQVRILGTRFIVHEDLRFHTSSTKPLLLKLIEDKRKWQAASFEDIIGRLDSEYDLPIGYRVPEEVK